MLNFKAILLGIAAGAAALFMAFIQGGQAAKNKILAKSERAARKAEQKANRALIEGIKKEDEVRDGKVDTSKRDHFSK